MAIKTYEEVKNTQRVRKLPSFAEVYKKNHGTDYVGKSTPQSAPIKPNFGGTENFESTVINSTHANAPIKPDFSGADNYKSTIAGGNPAYTPPKSLNTFGLKKVDTSSMQTPTVGNGLTPGIAPNKAIEMQKVPEQGTLGAIDPNKKLSDVAGTNIPMFQREKKTLLPSSVGQVATDLDYAGKKFATGVANGVSGSVAGPRAMAGSILTNGKQDADFKTLSDFFAENPQDENMLYQGVGNFEIAKETGVPLQSLNEYKLAHSTAHVDNQIENQYGEDVSGLGKMGGKLSYMAGNQAVSAIYPGEVGTLAIMGASATGNQFVNNADTNGQNVNNIPNAIGNGLMEVATEKMFGGVGLKGSLSAGKQGLKSYLKNVAQEGLEEVVNVPLSNTINNMSYHNTDKLVGDGGIFDIKAMAQNGLDGAILSAITGGAGAVVNIHNEVKQTNNVKKGVEQLNSVIQTIPDQFKPQLLNSSENITPEQLQSKENEVLTALSQYKNVAIQEKQATSNVQQQTPQVPQDTQANNTPITRQVMPTVTTTPKIEAQSGYGENGQKAYQSEMYKNESNPVYKGTFDAFYNGAKNGDNFESIDKLTGSQGKDITTKLIAYNSGQNDLKLDTANAEIRKTGGIIQSSFSKKMQKSESETYDVVDVLGKAINRAIEIHDTLDGGKANGYYKDGVIHIALDAENPMLDVAKHEVTHALKETSPQAYKNLADYIVANLKKSGTFESISHQISKDYGPLIKNNDDLYDEIVANAAEDFFKNENSINELAKTNKNLAEKIRDNIRELLQKFKNALAKLSKQNPNYAEMALGVEQLQTAEKLWVKALGEGKNNSISEDTKYSLKGRERLVDSGAIEIMNDGVLSIKNASLLTLKDWGKIATAARKVGYYIRSAEDAQRVYSIMSPYDLNIDMSKPVIKALGVGEDAVKTVEQQNVDKAKKEFGTTTNWNETGYLLIDGSQLDFSEKRDGGPANVRPLDHRSIERIYDDTQGTNSLKKFISEGNIRVLPESGSLDIAAIPTEKQVAKLTQYINKNNGEINLDISDGNNSDYREYNVGASAYKINSDIEYFFKNGELPKISDISQFHTKYSLKPNTDEGKQALADSAKLREENERLKREFTLTEGNRSINSEATEKLAKRFVKDFNIKADIKEISSSIAYAFNKITSMQKDNVSWNEVQEINGKLAEKILDKAVYVDDVLYQQYSDLRKYLRNTKMTLSEADKSNIADFNNFRKENMGRLRLSQDGMPIDVIWQELSSNYPEFFNESEIMHNADKLQYIADLSRSLDKSYDSFKNTNDYNSAKKMLANQLWEDYLDTPQEKKTYADKAQEKLMLEKSYSAEKLRNLRSTKNESIAKLKAENVQKVNNMVSKERAKSSEKQQQIKDRAKEVFENYRDRRNKTTLKDKVWKKTKDLHKMLTNPTERRYVPEEMKKPIAEFLQSVVNAYKTDTNTIIEIKRDGMINTYRKMIENSDNEFSYDFDDDMLDMIDSIPDKKVADMNVSEVENLNRVIMSLTKTITEANKLKRIEKYHDIADAGGQMISDLSVLKTKSESTKLIVSQIDQMINSDMLQPLDFFEQLGGVGTAVYNEFRTALDKKIVNLETTENYMHDLIGENKISEWTDKTAKATKFYVKGGSIELTPAQVMSLYLLNKRKQATDHIYVGGIKQAPTTATYTENENGKKVTKTRIKSNTSKVVVDVEDVANILNTLTDEQKAVADGIGKFLTTTTSEWANEVSMEMYGYKKFTEKNYFPIKSDENYLQSEYGVQMDSTLKNKGWSKSTTRKANNPIIIEDIFDVFTRQADEASSYNAFVVPISDMTKIMNYKGTETSVKQSIQSKYGSSATSYISKFANDINGGIRTEPGTGIIRGMLGKYKSAAMGLNARVIIQQPTALIRASAVINPKYLIKGMTGKVTFEEVKKHCPIAKWKDWGYFTLDTGRQMKDILIGKKRLADYTMAAVAKADNLAWRTLWNAVESETKDLNPTVEYGSDKFYEICKNRFNYIVDKTQVVDTVLHRSQLTRSNDTAVKVYSSFMSEPLKTYNLLRTSFRNYAIDKSEANRNNVIRTASTYIATSMATAFVCTLADLWRSDDDDDKFWTIYFGNMGNDMTGMFPILKDVTSYFNGFAPKRMEYSGIEKLNYAFKKLDKNIKAMQAGKPGQYTAVEVTKEFARGIGELTGVPFNSAFRELESIYNNIAKVTKSHEMEYAKAKMFYDVRNSDNAARYKKILWEAYSDGGAETAQTIYSDLVANGMSKSDLMAYIESQLRKQVKEDSSVNNLYQSWKSKDKVTLQKYVEEVKKKGYTQDQVDTAFKSYEKTDRLSYGSPKKIYDLIQSGKKKKAVEMYNAMMESGLWTDEEIGKGIENYSK